MSRRDRPDLAQRSKRAMAAQATQRARYTHPLRAPRGAKPQAKSANPLSDSKSQESSK
jgi:hypothetical protein